MKYVNTYENFINEEKKFYYQTALRLKPEEQAEIKKMVPDVEFEIDDSSGHPDDEPRQLVWSNVADEKKLSQIVAKVTKQPGA